MEGKLARQSRAEKVLEREAERLSSLATHDNPVSVLMLGAVLTEAKRLINQAYHEDTILTKLREFIEQLGKRT
jgi:hypothetical protein